MQILGDISRRERDIHAVAILATLSAERRGGCLTSMVERHRIGNASSQAASLASVYCGLSFTTAQFSRACNHISACLRGTGVVEMTVLSVPVLVAQPIGIGA